MYLILLEFHSNSNIFVFYGASGSPGAQGWYGVYSMAMVSMMLKIPLVFKFSMTLIVPPDAQGTYDA